MGLPEPTTPTFPPGPSGTENMLDFFVVDMKPDCTQCFVCELFPASLGMRPCSLPLCKTNTPVHDKTMVQSSLQSQQQLPCHRNALSCHKSGAWATPHQVTSALVSGFTFFLEPLPDLKSSQDCCFFCVCLSISWKRCLLLKLFCSFFLRVLVFSSSVSLICTHCGR